MGKANTDQLQGLIDLARKRTRENRRILFENMTSLFLSAEGRLSERELALMTDIINKLVHEVEMAVRVKLADRLADLEAAPRELVVNLAKDDISVARPVLMRSGVLEDRDLVEIVRHRTHEHIVAVANRSRLSETVTDAILDQADEEIIEALINNGDAALSRRAMEYLVDQSRRVDRFQQPLLRRADLPPDLAHRMFWWVSAALREYVLKAFEIGETELDEMIHDAATDALGETEPEDETAAERLVRRLDDTGELTPRYLVKCVRHGQIAVFVAAVARLCRLDRETAQRVIFDRGGESLAIACRAMGFDRTDFASIFLATRPPGDGNHAATVMNNILALYDSVSDKMAKRALAFWRQDADYGEAIEQMAG